MNDERLVGNSESDDLLLRLTTVLTDRLLKVKQCTLRQALVLLCEGNGLSPLALKEELNVPLMVFSNKRTTKKTLIYYLVKLFGYVFNLKLDS